MKKIINIIILILVCAFSYTQNKVKGTFPGLANQQIKLVGFEGFDTHKIDSVKANDKGIFSLSFGKKDYGMGYLSAEDNKPFFIILTEEAIKLKGEAFAFPEAIEILEGTENQIFEQYASEHPRREQALSAWVYLEKIYTSDSLFAGQDVPKQAIAEEKKRIKAEDSLYLAGLASETYVSWYLPLRKLVSSVSTIAQYRTEEIPATIAAFRDLDYTDERLYNSGLLKDAVESHFWLIENSGGSLDSVYAKMEVSIDHLLENLTRDEKKLNEITDYLFNLLERHSLFEASEYLALKVLNETTCTLNNDLASQLESYRRMKKGNTAPDFAFNVNVLAPGYESSNIPEKLSAINSEYILVVFGASWCPACPEELSQIAGLYENWKAFGVEVVFFSLDQDKQNFEDLAGTFPFVSICDYQEWGSPVVKSWHVFATPTMYLVDNNLEILLRPDSIKQMDAWVDWYLVQGNN